MTSGPTTSSPSQPRRALVLAGGGMRVVWQAGVIRALAEAGLDFPIGDGTSGGILNLAMLYSGLSPEEMCERGRTLRVRRFFSPASPSYYLRALNAPALSSPSAPSSWSPARRSMRRSKIRAPKRSL